MDFNVTNLVEFVKDMKEKLKISEDLEFECGEQPILYQIVGETFTEAKAETKRAKIRLGIVDSKLKHNIRTHLSDFGLPKYSESAIETLIPQQDEHIKANEAFIEAEKISENLNVLVESFGQRKSMLRDIVAIRQPWNYNDPSDYRRRREQSTSAEEKIVEERERKNRS